MERVVDSDSSSDLVTVSGVRIYLGSSMQNFDFSPVHKEFSVDVSRHVFKKECDVEPSMAEFLQSFIGRTGPYETKVKLAHISKPVTKYHDSVRELCALSIAQKLKRSYVCDSIIELIEWKLNKETHKCILSLHLASLGNLYDYCGLDLDISTSYIMHESIEGEPEVKYSFIIRLLFTVYALNNIADISHNDLGTKNILVETCEYKFIRVCFYKGKTLESILVPTFGVKLLICDFGMASRFSSAENPWSDYDFILHCFEGRNINQSVDNESPAWRVPSDTISTALHYYEQLRKIDPEFANSADETNTQVWDLTYEPGEERMCTCSVT